MNRGRAARARAGAALLLCGALLAGCGLKSGSPMVDDVRPGTVGRGRPLKGAQLTVTSKEFTEQLVLGAVMGIAFQAAGASVQDRTGIQGSIGAREAVKSGDADAMYEYTGTAWITYLGNNEPIADPHGQWVAVRDADKANGVTWLPPARLDNTYALAVNPATEKKYGVKSLSQAAELARRDPGAVTLCVESEFASRQDGLPGMQRKYGMDIPASDVRKMDGGIVYTELSSGRSCAFGEVFTTDGRIKALDLTVLDDDKDFFPNYNVAPEINSATLEKYPAIPEVLAPITAKLDNALARELNAKVAVQGQDPHTVALEWMLSEGFVKD
ncbi:glycine betaine ABC transporter substrate-binding protein [Streptomyces sp. BBFR102]|uniref:glycine betaine ABC transporter substrate-binding protein n=1 Tax=Streptomyces sp. BBFR102 TaxID=3448171 RepID=UPI003F52A5C3